jgi:hypothetical protein
VKSPDVQYARSGNVLAGSRLEFEDRGAHELKGVPGEWRLYAVDA